LVKPSKKAKSFGWIKRLFLKKKDKTKF